MATFRVTVDHTKVAGDLAHFPVYVDLTHMPTAFWTSVYPDGADIRCYVGGVQVPREIVSCDVEARTGEMYVRVPVSGTADTAITVTTGGGVTDYGDDHPLGAKAVWSNGFTTVLHLGDDPDGENLRDSLGSRTIEPVAPAAAADGVAGGALSFDGEAGYVSWDGSGTSGNAPLTTSMWVKWDGTDSVTMFALGDLSDGALWEMSIYGGDLILHAWGDGFDTIGESAPVPQDEWAHCALTHDGTTVRVYVNGVLQGQRDMTLDIGPLYWVLGMQAYFGYWQGALDEFRQSSVARSAEWLATEHANLGSPNTFYAVEIVPAAVVEGSLAVPSTLGPPTLYLDRNQHVTLHTFRGVQLDQYGPDQQLSLSWGRERNQTSKATVAVPSGLVRDAIPEIIPWHHWISVWDDTGRNLHWTGPVMGFSGDRDQLTIRASDISAYFHKTVTPLRKRWDATDPAFVARELLEAVLELQGLNAVLQTQPDPRIDKIDFAMTNDEQVVAVTLEELVNLGLRWSVTMGTVVLGPLSLKAVDSLDGARDFVGGSPILVRDGSDMANEVILRAANTIARARVPVPGPNLQRIVDIDSMFSVSNAQRVCEQYVREMHRPRDVLQLPNGVRLNPDAQVTLDMLVPSVRFNLAAYGMLSLMELAAMEVTCAQGDISVSVTMETVNDDPPELEKFTTSGGFVGLTGGL